MSKAIKYFLPKEIISKLLKLGKSAKTIKSVDYSIKRIFKNVLKKSVYEDDILVTKQADILKYIGGDKVPISTKVILLASLNAVILNAKYRSEFTKYNAMKYETLAVKTVEYLAYKDLVKIYEAAKDVYNNGSKANGRYYQYLISSFPVYFVPLQLSELLSVKLLKKAVNTSDSNYIDMKSGIFYINKGGPKRHITIPLKLLDIIKLHDRDYLFSSVNKKDESVSKASYMSWMKSLYGKYRSNQIRVTFDAYIYSRHTDKNRALYAKLMGHKYDTLKLHYSMYQNSRG